MFFSRNTGQISTKLGTKHPWVKGTKVCSNEGLCHFPRGDNYEIAKIHWRNFKNFLLKNHWTNSNQTCHNAFFGEGDSKLFKWRALPISKWRSLWNRENTLMKLEQIFFSRTTGPISTKLGIKHPWVKWVQVSSNEGHCPFPRWDNNEIAKIHWQI